MNHKEFRLRASSAVTLTVSCLLVLCALTAFAQSGRRTKKSASSVPVPTPEATATPTPSPTPERPSIPILLGVNSFDSYGDIPFYFNESVARSCAQGLEQRGYIHVELSSRDLSRADALKRAKAAKQGYVALLELHSDRMRTNDRNTNLSSVYIDYIVYAAGTGKPVTAGNVYQQASGLRDVIVGRRDSTSVAEQRLKYAARIAAERILAAIAGREP